MTGPGVFGSQVKVIFRGLSIKHGTNPILHRKATNLTFLSVLSNTK